MNRRRVELFALTVCCACAVIGVATAFLWHHSSQDETLSRIERTEKRSLIGKQTVIHFSVQSNEILFPAIIEGRQVQCLFDTGNESQLNWPSTLDLPGKRFNITRQQDRAGGVAIAHLVELGKVQIGTFSAVGVPSWSDEISVPVRHSNVESVGLSLFDGYNVRIDYPHRTLTISDAVENWKVHGTTLTGQFVGGTDGSAPALEGEVHGIDTTCIIDTGSNCSVLSRRYADSLQISHRAHNGGTGRSLESRFSFDRTDQAVDFVDEGITVASFTYALDLPKGVDAIIGGDALQHYVLTLNRRAGIVLLSTN